MGNTIRREPVNFNIPDSPNYKFLNITNFRGLDVSSNPFELATNTASDCLNVYVDETNTLTTRPRLEQKIAAPIDGEHIGTHKLHNGYLLHYDINIRDEETNEITGNELAIYLLQDGQLNTNSVTGQIPSEISQCFEQGDDIYLLGDNRYMVISNNILSDVDGYIPNRSIVRLDGTTEGVEKLNLLTDKYIEKSFWNGTVDELQNDSYIHDNVVYITNDYYKPFTFNLPYADMQIDKWFSDKTFIASKYNNITNLYEYYYCIFEKDFSNIIATQISFGDFNPTRVAIADNKDAVGFGNTALNNNVLVYFKWNGAGWEYVRETIIGTGLNDYFPLKISKSGKYVYYRKFGERTQTHIWNTIDDTIESTTNRTQYDETRIIISPNETVGVELCSWWIDGWKYQAIYPFTLGPYESEDSLNAILTHNDSGDFSDDGKYFYAYSSTDEKFVFVIDFSQEQKQINKIPFSEDFLVDRFQPYDNSFVIPKRTSEDDFYLYYGDLSEPLNVANSYFKWDTTFIKYQHKNYIVGSGTNPLKLALWQNDKEPHIKVCKILTLNDDDYAQWSQMKNRLIDSQLFTRFDNNYWLASGNTYFRSQYNDPTYFPITEYSELGDSNEDITGFNIANDTTLLMYKPSRLYLIQPFYSEATGMTEYSKTESKNTVGNTAIGAPIVTTLTEIPIQINNDGIYGLSQVANVSAIERIADLMSEPINDRWLNEDDTVIKKAMTLNRLYWTYIILPYEKLTKVYLLDNRTNSWYYWELPIKLSNAFAKDNHAEFVDTDGNIYYLTTTDIRNMGFDTQLVTEYYDYGKVLIPWLWQSQVLYLGTMNYAKRLVNTTFILTDTDTQDGYGLQYSFKVFRKLASAVPEKELSGDLTLVRSTTKKTNISKFGFLQIKLSNITEDSQGTEAEKAYRNNKLRLVGLGLKYVLLEGLIR